MQSSFHEESLLLNHRLIYIPSEASLTELHRKTNESEVNIILQLITYWQNVLKREQLDWSIGVITPFRAQIAAIQYKAFQSGVDLSGITIDTVERYQGGARDIILMTCAVNSAASLSRITSINEDGIDRKLNVAVTRARQQFILVGVKSVLQPQPSYQALINLCHEVEKEIISLPDTEFASPA